jgi:cobalt/nickel transport system permease protein
MHMADALLSPAVGAAMWAASGATLVWCSRRIRNKDQDHLVPLMGVLGAFVFAAQMINFTIPATGSSGHIGGGLLLSILLGPHAAFVVIASVLTVQALFFADGGLLALGANIFNLGVLPSFIGYLLVYSPLLGRPLLGKLPTARRISIVTVLAAIVALQLGALGVVLQTQLSGISSLPLGTFLLLMQPIHLAIGLVEGLATAAIVLFVRRARPDLFAGDRLFATAASPSLKPLLAVLCLAAALTAGIFSWFASTRPDGLEWSIARATGSEVLPAPVSDVHAALDQAQQKTAWLPDYKLQNDNAAEGTAAETGHDKAKPTEAAAWPAVDPGASLAGLIGGAATLGLVMTVGYLLGRRRSKS